MLTGFAYRLSAVGEFVGAYVCGVVGDDVLGGWRDF